MHRDARIGRLHCEHGARRQRLDVEHDATALELELAQHGAALGELHAGADRSALDRDASTGPRRDDTRARRDGQPAAGGQRHLGLGDRVIIADLDVGCALARHEREADPVARRRRTVWTEREHQDEPGDSAGERRPLHLPPAARAPRRAALELATHRGDLPLAQERRLGRWLERVVHGIDLSHGRAAARAAVEVRTDPVGRLGMQPSGVPGEQRLFCRAADMQRRGVHARASGFCSSSLPRAARSRRLTVRVEQRRTAATSSSDSSSTSCKTERSALLAVEHVERRARSSDGAAAIDQIVGRGRARRQRRLLGVAAEPGAHAIVAARARDDAMADAENEGRDARTSFEGVDAAADLLERRLHQILVLLAVARAGEAIDDAIDRRIERRHQRVERRRIARAMARHERSELRLRVGRRGGGWALTAIHLLCIPFVSDAARTAGTGYRVANSQADRYGRTRRPVLERRARRVSGWAVPSFPGLHRATHRVFEDFGLHSAAGTPGKADGHLDGRA